MSKFKVSVIIPCYDAVSLLQNQLDALVEQIDPPLFEVLLSDNGKNEGINDLVNVYKEKLFIRVVDSTQKRVFLMREIMLF